MALTLDQLWVVDDGSPLDGSRAVYLTEEEARDAAQGKVVIPLPQAIEAELNDEDYDGMPEGGKRD
jgi:hypothetical protein